MNPLCIIQLDGVSFQVITQAIQKGYMPHVKKLLARGWKLNRIFSGIPSTTPAGQMNIVYGQRDIILGFHFLLKKEKQYFAAENYSSLEMIENIAEIDTSRSLIKDGAAVMTLYRGNAPVDYSFSLAKRNKKTIWHIVSYMFHPKRTLLFLLKCFVLFLIEVQERPHSVQKKKTFWHVIPYVFERIALELGHGELSFHLIKESLKKGAPTIYANFAGYDGLSHYYGPESKFAYFYLSLLDLYVRDCIEAAETLGGPHEVVFLSDHGQAPAQSMQSITGSSLVDTVRALYPGKRIGYERDVHSYMHARENYDLLLLSSGGLSLIYDMESEHCISLGELDKKYPDFCKHISQLPTIGCILGLQDKKPVCWKDGNVHSLNEKFFRSIVGYVADEHKHLVYDRFHDLLRAPFAADGYIFAKQLGEQSFIGFEDQIGVHGGFGGNQTSSFILTKHIAIDTKKVKDLADVHDLLYEYIYGAKR